MTNDGTGPLFFFFCPAFRQYGYAEKTKMADPPKNGT